MIPIKSWIGEVLIILIFKLEKMVVTDLNIILVKDFWKNGKQIFHLYLNDGVDIFSEYFQKVFFILGFCFHESEHQIVTH